MRISYREGDISGEHIFEKHCHARYEMIAVIEGEIGLIIENKKYELRAGRVAIIPPFKYHSVFTVGNTVYKRMTALFESSFIPEEISEDFKQRVYGNPIAANREIEDILRSVKELFSESEHTKFFPLASGLILQAVYIHTYKEIAPLEESSDPTLNMIIEYVDMHIGEKILLDDIASALFISKSTLCHRFAAEMKISLKQYVLHKKLSYAAHLIENGTSAAEAAARIGYENYANFYKMYRKIFGISPRQACDELPSGNVR